MDQLKKLFEQLREQQIVAARVKTSQANLFAGAVCAEAQEQGYKVVHLDEDPDVFNINVKAIEDRWGGLKAVPQQKEYLHVVYYLRLFPKKSKIMVDSEPPVTIDWEL